MKKIEDMTIEELRSEYIKINDSLKLEKSNNDVLNNKIKENENAINNLNSNIADLKQKNYDLFIKVSNPIENTNKNSIEEKTISLDSLILELGDD